MPPGSTEQPATSARKTHRGDRAEAERRRLLRSKVMVDAASPYPVTPTRKRPRWWIRLRGLVGMSFLVALLGVLLAASIGVVLALLAVWAITALT